MANRRIWWATWPGALGVGLLSLLMVLAGAVPLALFALLATSDPSGTDATVVEAPGIGLRVLWMVLAVVSLVLPVVVVVLARRRWLGWMLAALVGSGAVLASGLGMMGIL
ncbi:MAG: hypothetical protein ABIS84_03505 [Arachnia sp.]